MGFCTARKLGAVLVVIWLCFMVYLWFPQIIPNILLKKGYIINKGIFRQEAIDVKNANVNFTDAVHICTTSDKNTLGGLIALINSIQQNTKHTVMFHIVIDEDSLDHARIWIEATKLRDIHYEIKVFPSEWVKDKILIRGGRKELASPLNYARYYLPLLFPKLHERIIFVDDDIIVQGDIYELYKMKLKHAIAFSKDCAGPSKRITLMNNNYADYIDFKNRHVIDMDMHPTECAFNTGLYVTDLDEWRKKNITQKLEYWLKLNTKEEVYGNEKGGGGSQPPMMIVFYKNYTEIDPSWHIRFLGWTSRSSYTKNFLSHQKLLHWNGRFKPWGRISQHKELWNKYFIPDPTNKFHPVRRS